MSDETKKPEAGNHLLERAIDPAFAAHLMWIMTNGPLKEEPKPEPKPQRRGFFDKEQS